MKTVLFLFGELTDLDMDWLVRHGTIEHISAGSVLIEKGRATDGLYIVLEGLFEIVVGGTVKRTIAELGAGEVLGEISFMDCRPPTTTVQALTDSVVFTLRRKCLETKLEEDAAFAARFYHAISKFLAHRLRVLTLKYSELDAEAEVSQSPVLQEMDEQVLAGVYLGGKRFERMLKKVALA